MKKGKKSSKVIQKKEVISEKVQEKRRTGWKPLPISLKVLFVILVIGFFSSIRYVSSIKISGYPLFGINILGISGMAIFILLNFAASLLFLYGMWRREKATAWYGIGYFLFFMVNGLISLTTLRARIPLIKQQFGFEFPGMDEFIYNSSVIGILIGVVINFIFLALIYANRKYFE